jgi:PD-(D/E)XK endonuclease
MHRRSRAVIHENTKAPDLNKPDTTSAVPPVILLYRVRFLAPRIPQETQAPDQAQLSLSASAEPEPDPHSKSKRRPHLSRRQPRQGTGGPRRRLKFTAKRLGEIAEAFFLAKAADLGFTVLKPWGDSEAYDFVLDAHHGARGFSRVQVKSAHRKGQGDKGYSFSAHDFSLHAYRERDVDAFIAYVVPEDVWYVIPIRDLKSTRGIHLFPTSKRRRSKYEKYRDAWWHLEK